MCPAEPERLRAWLATRPHAPRAIVDLGSPDGVVARFRAAFATLEPGGGYLLTGHAGHAALTRLRRWLAANVEVTSRSGGQDDSGPVAHDKRHRDDQALRDLVVQTRRVPQGLLLRRGGPGIDTLLATDGPALERSTVVARRHEAALPQGEPVRSNGALELTGRDFLSTAPPLFARAYHDVECFPHQVLRAGGAILPETFRDPAARRLRSRGLRPVSRWHVVRPGPEPTRRLEGTYLHLDTDIVDHFGHVVTEQLGRCWALAELLAQEPELRILGAVGRNQPLPAWQTDLLAAAGVPLDRLDVVEGPVRVQRLIAVTPGYVIGRWIHPSLREVHRAVEEHFVDGPPIGAPVFLTRPDIGRDCRNRDEVERRFAAHGFRIVSPADLPVAEQIRLVSRAPAVAGFAGSNLLHLAFASEPRPVLAISADTYHAHNEYQFSRLWGHALTVCLNPADVPRPPSGRFSGASYRSSFAVDWASDAGALIEEWLTAR